MKNDTVLIVIVAHIRCEVRVLVYMFGKEIRKAMFAIVNGPCSLNGNEWQLVAMILYRRVT